jgi:hypothetical protein
MGTVPTLITMAKTKKIALTGHVEPWVAAAFRRCAHEQKTLQIGRMGLCRLSLTAGKAITERPCLAQKATPGRSLRVERPSGDYRARHLDIETRHSPTGLGQTNAQQALSEFQVGAFS